MKATFIFFLGASQIAAGEALQPRKIVSLGPAGVCPPAPVVTIELQPVYCRALTPNNGGRDLSLDENNVAVSIYSTTTCLSTILTRTIFDLSLAALPTGTITASSPLSPTIVSSSKSAELVATTPIASVPIFGSNLYIGAGLPSGTVSDLPDNQFLFLGFSSLPAPTPPAAKRVNLRRQEPSMTALPLTMVDLSRPTELPGGLDQDDCDESSPVLLRSGSLLQSERAVEKMSGEMNPILGFLKSPPANPVNTSFILIDGILKWTTPDTGHATFYNCNGMLYASFEGGISGCVQVVVFAIAGRACIERVQQTRQPNTIFTPPQPIMSSSTTSVSSSSGSGTLLSMEVMVSDTSSATSTSMISHDVNVLSAIESSYPAFHVSLSDIGAAYTWKSVSNPPTTASLSSVPQLLSGPTSTSETSLAVSASPSRSPFNSLPASVEGYAASLSQSRTRSSTVTMSTISSSVAIFSTGTSATPNRFLATSSIEVSSPGTSFTTIVSAAGSSTASLSTPVPSTAGVDLTSSTDATSATTSIATSGTSTSTTTNTAISSRSPPPPIDHDGDCQISASLNFGSGGCGCTYDYTCNMLVTFNNGVEFHVYELDGVDGNHMDYCAYKCDADTTCKSFLVFKANQVCITYDEYPDTMEGRSGFDFGMRSFMDPCRNLLCYRV